ncbi:hypothetical protein [Yersinia intermedia]|uniref:hypothetical protein n=1 Tax=Yersinia intermedia TaxID=631 RepID=UPI0039C62142
MRKEWIVIPEDDPDIVMLKQMSAADFARMVFMMDIKQSYSADDPASKAEQPPCALDLFKADSEYPLFQPDVYVIPQHIDEQKNDTKKVETYSPNTDLSIICQFLLTYRFFHDQIDVASCCHLVACKNVLYHFIAKSCSKSNTVDRYTYCDDLIHMLRKRANDRRFSQDTHRMLQVFFPDVKAYEAEMKTLVSEKLRFNYDEVCDMGRIKSTAKTINDFIVSIQHSLDCLVDHQFAGKASISRSTMAALWLLNFIDLTLHYRKRIFNNVNPYFKDILEKGLSLTDEDMHINIFSDEHQHHGSNILAFSSLVIYFFAAKESLSMKGRKVNVDFQPFNIHPTFGYLKNYSSRQNRVDKNLTLIRKLYIKTRMYFHAKKQTQLAEKAKKTHGDKKNKNGDETSPSFQHLLPEAIMGYATYKLTLDNIYVKEKTISNDVDEIITDSGVSILDEISAIYNNGMNVKEWDSDSGYTCCQQCARYYPPGVPPVKQPGKPTVVIPPLPLRCCLITNIPVEIK